MACRKAKLQNGSGEVLGMGRVVNLHVTFMEQPARAANW
jgi:hypothetical protein